MLELLMLGGLDTRPCEKQAMEGTTGTKPREAPFQSPLPRGNLLTALPLNSKGHLGNKVTWLSAH